MNKVLEISNIKKEKIFNMEKQNIEKIASLLKDKNEVRQNSKGELNTKQFELNNLFVYELSNKNSEQKTILISAQKLKGLTWMDMTLIQEDSSKWDTNIENGLWITSYNNIIRYTISNKKQAIIGLQIEKIGESSYRLSYFCNSAKLSSDIESGMQNEILFINLLKKIEFENSTIKEIIEEFYNKCIYIDKYETERQVLIAEKQALENDVNELNEKINKIVSQIEEISRQADVAEQESKKTIEEISKVTKENENLKNSIINIRKNFAKKFSFIPIIGKIIMKELNKEFGEDIL